MQSEEDNREDDIWEPPKIDDEGATSFPSTSAQSAMKDHTRMAKHACGVTVCESHTFCYKCGKKIEKTIFEADDGLGNHKSAKVDEKATKSITQLAIDLEEGPKQPIKFGSAGRSAMGKSSFINTILNKKPGDEDYAKTGHGDTTKETKLYTHSVHPNFQIWDTPGFGSLNMTKEEFLKTVDLKTFDVFFIFFDNVLNSDDLWIAKTLADLKVSFCLVRCKVDIIVDEAKKSKQPNSINTAVEELRSNLRSTMDRYDVLKNARIFLISNIKMYFQYGDWTDLLLFLAEQIPDIKREALFFILPVLTPETLTLKYNELRRRITKVAILAGAISAIPVPFLDAPINIGIVVREVLIYRDVLGLNSDFAKYHVHATDETSLKEKVMKGLGMATTAAFSGGTAVAGVILSQVDVLIPVVGSAVSAVSVNRVVSYYLNKTLDQTHDEAKKLYQKITTPNQN